MAAHKDCATCLRYLVIEGRIEHLTDTHRFREASELATAIPAAYFDCDHCGRHVDARFTAGYLSC